METIVEPIPHNSEPNAEQDSASPEPAQGKPFIPHRFTPEKAREARQMQIETARRNAAILRGEIEIGIPPAVQPRDEYVSEQLREAREEIQRLKALARQMTAPADIERMSRAIREWAEQERKLAGRPLPGALRPKTSKRGRGGAEMM